MLVGSSSICIWGNILLAVSDDTRNIAVASNHGGRGKDTSDLGENHFQ